MQQIQDDVLDRKPELPASDEGVAGARLELNTEHGVRHLVEYFGGRSVENPEAFSTGPFDPRPTELTYRAFYFAQCPTRFM